MGKPMKQIKYAVAIVAVCTMVLMGVGSAHAAKKTEHPERGLYAGFGVGVSEFEHIDNEAFSWRMMFWVRAHRYLAIEGGYVNPGDPTEAEDVDGVHAALVPMFPICEKLTLFGKVGVLIGTNSDSTDEELTYGFGATYDLPDSLPKGLGIRAEWERFDESAIDTFTIGPYFQFGSF